MNIHLQIERLILEGLPVSASESGLLQEAVEAELARLLTTGDFVPNASTTEARIQATEIRMSQSTSAHRLGRQIGQSVYAAALRTSLASRRGEFTNNSKRTPGGHTPVGPQGNPMH